MGIVVKVPWCADPIVAIPGLGPKLWPTETGFQVYCADWLRKQAELYPNERGYRHWHHSANERYGALAGFRARMMGQGKGFPDFVCPGLKLAIELKVPGGVVSEPQRRWLEHFTDVGWRASAVYNFETFRTIVLETINAQGSNV